MQISRRQILWLLIVGLAAAALAGVWISIGTPASPAPAALTSEESEWLAAHGPLRLAPDPFFRPIEYFDADGQYVGLVADYMRLIGRRLGAPIEIIRYPTWDDVLAAARAGEVDGITAAQVTPERSLYLAYTEPLIDIPNVIITRGDTGGELEMADLVGQRVAVTQGNAIDEYLRERFPGITVAAKPDDLVCLRDVAFGRADATVVNLAIASDLIERHGITNLRVVGDSGRSNALAIATRADLPILADIMRKGLAAVTRAERAAISKRWIRLEVATFHHGRRLALLLSAGLGAMMLAAALFLVWNAILRRQVAAATAELRTELGERRRVEAALRDSERKLTLHLEQNLFFVIEFDLEARVRAWNPAAEEIFGYTREEAIGRSGRELFVPEDEWPRLQHVWADLAAGKGGRHSVNRNRRKDGSLRTCEWFNTTLVSEQGEPVGVLSIGKDITDRVRSAEALAQTQRLESLAILAGGIAHDFNNLLAGILGNVSLVESDPRLPTELAEAIREAAAAAMRARGLTHQLLTFSTGGAPVWRVVDPEKTVRDAAQFALSGSRSRCEIAAAGDLWPMRADPNQLAQAVQNLVLNASEAMGGQGVVEIELGNLELGAHDRPTAAPGPHLRLQVSDRGPGIPEEIRHRVFDPFFSTKQRGSGLGLAICHSIAQRHGGAIRALAREGGGTTIEMLLQALPGGRIEAESRPETAAGIRARVLVLDDEEALRRLGSRLLSDLGCVTETAADGEEAVRRFETARERGEPFDVVVLDLTVPGGWGGVETLARLREIEPGVRAVVSSGYSTGPVMSSYREHGFSAVLPKPFTRADLLRALETALADDRV